MPYTAPTTRAAEFKVTAAVWNTDIVENIKYFKDAPVFDGDVSLSATKKLFFDGGGNTYVQEVSADTLVAVTNGTERLRITSGGNVHPGSNDGGALGISGTAWADLFLASGGVVNFAASEATITHSASNTLSFGTSGSERLRITSGGDVAVAATAKLYLDGVAATGNTYLQEVSADTIVAVTNGSERLRITSGGVVIVGSGEASTTPVGNTLRATSGTGTDITGGTLTITAGNGTGTGGSGIITFWTAAAGTTGTTANTMTERLRIDMNGRTIIYGTSTQQYPLLVGQTASTSAALLFFNNTSGQFYIGNENSAGNAAGAGSGAAYARTIWGEGAYPMVFGTNNAERLRITSGGVVIVGSGEASASPVGNTFRAPSGSGTDITGGTLTITAGNGTGTGGSGAIIFQTAAAGSTGTTANTMAERLRIDNRGNVGLNVSAFGTSAANVLAIKNGTEPTTGPADTVQIYSVDRSAGNTIPAIYCEGTGVTDAGITSTTVTHKIAMKVNGTVYYLLATTSAS